MEAFVGTFICFDNSGPIFVKLYLLVYFIRFISGSEKIYLNDLSEMLYTSDFS